MDQTQSPQTPADTAVEAPTVDPLAEADDLVASDDLIEEVSIDGMCGVY